MPEISVNFGPAYTGLSTVGYKLDGAARTTAGVSELAAGTGMYGATISDTYAGRVLWDTGGGSPVYAVDDVRPTTTIGGSSVSGTLPTTFLTSRESSVFCTDEDVAIRAGEDFGKVCPRSQRLAYGSDGAALAASPWVLTSGTVNFGSQGVQPGVVLLLSKSSSSAFAPAGELFVVASVAGSSVTLRRPGLASGVGQPITLTDLSAVAFDCRTFAPQIDNATYKARKFFGIDPNVTGVKPTDLYDPRELQQYTVLNALLQAYVAAEKTAQTDFTLKIQSFQAELDQLTSMLTIRWGTAGDGKPTTSIFSARMRR